MQKKIHNGFTLVELLISIAIIGILATITIVAINPTKQMGDARNAQRKVDINAILNAFGQYSIESGGFFQPKIINGDALMDECKVGTTPKNLCKATTPHTDAENGCKQAACVYSAHLKGTFLADVPSDPIDAEDTATEQATLDYLVSSMSPGRFRVDGPNAENGQIIGAIR